MNVHTSLVWFLIWFVGYLYETKGSVFGYSRAVFDS